MTSLVQFGSALAERIVSFIAFKRMQGYDYRSGAEELRRFDSFLTENAHATEILELEIMQHYAETIADLSHSSRVGRLSTVRQFSVYMHALSPDSMVLPPRLVPKAPRSIRFQMLSAAQIDELMAATDRLQPDNGIRAACMRFLVGLLASTGLRPTEATALNLGDVCRDEAMLFVRRGKARKQRLVPFDASTGKALDEWLSLRSEYAGNDAHEPLLVAARNRRLSRDRACRLFRRLCRDCGINGTPPVRLYDLRHHYACACLARWREAGEDVDALLPVLANMMGHSHFHDTEVYIHVNAGALQQAAEKFQRHVYGNMEHAK